MVIVSRNHHLSWDARGRLLPSLKVMLRGFVRRNIIGHHGCNGRESTNQVWQHISHRKRSYISSFIVWSWSTLYRSKDNPVFSSRFWVILTLFPVYSRSGCHFSVSPNSPGPLGTLYSTLLNWPIVSLLILFILFSTCNVFVF